VLRRPARLGWTGTAGEGGGVTTRVRGRATLNGATVYGHARPTARRARPPRPRPRPTGNGREGSTREGRRRLLAADRMELTGLDAQWPKVRVGRLHLPGLACASSEIAAGRFPIAESCNRSDPTRRPHRRPAPPRSRRPPVRWRSRSAKIEVEQAGCGSTDARSRHPRACASGDRAHRERRHVAGPAARPGQVLRQHPGGRHVRAGAPSRSIRSLRAARAPGGRHARPIAPTCR